MKERLPPAIDDFIVVADNAYDRRCLIDMEANILRTVRFDLGVPLSYTFLRRYSKCVRADMKLLTLARYVLELALQDYAFATESETVKACAALYLALKLATAYEQQLKAAGVDLAKANLIVATANLSAVDWVCQ